MRCFIFGPALTFVFVANWDVFPNKNCKVEQVTKRYDQNSQNS